MKSLYTVLSIFLSVTTLWCPQSAAMSLSDMMHDTNNEEERSVNMLQQQTDVVEIAEGHHGNCGGASCLDQAKQKLASAFVLIQTNDANHFVIGLLPILTTNSHVLPFLLC
ncbi:MAG: hypothetical protein O2904_03580 [bacterium]|nr:hypothetical protein [bacterium]